MSSRLLIFLHTFVEKFQCCYRDGVDGMKNVRSFSGSVNYQFSASTYVRPALFGHSHQFSAALINFRARRFTVIYTGMITNIRTNSRRSVRLTMPRKRRKRKRRSTETPVVSKRPKKYRKWSEESMSGAVKAVIDGKMGVNRAADQYGIPRSTLKDRVSAKHGAKSGLQPYLSC